MQCKRVLEEFQTEFLGVKIWLLHIQWTGCAGTWSVKDVKVNHGGLMAAAAATLRALLR
jgi:hypothetical protein